MRLPGLVLVMSFGMTGCGDSQIAKPSSWAVRTPATRGLVLDAYSWSDAWLGLHQARCVVAVTPDNELYVGNERLGALTPEVLRKMTDRVRSAWPTPKTEADIGEVWIKAPDRATYATIRPVVERLLEAKLIANFTLAIDYDDAPPFAQTPCGGRPRHS
jgi:hypothetical protein